MYLSGVLFGLPSALADGPQVTKPFADDLAVRASPSRINLDCSSSRQT